MIDSERKTRRRVIEVIAIVVVAFVACTSGGETYTLVTDCIPDVANDAGCDGGTPYTCNNGALPSDSDPTLICENGSPGASGSTIFCCDSQGASSSGCSVNGTCAGGQTAYLCTGAGSPSQSDSTLICQADPSTGANAYCCIAGDSGTTSSSCTEEADGGCTGGANFFVCPSSMTPNTSDPTLNCGAPTALSSGFASYCCSN